MPKVSPLVSSAHPDTITICSHYPAAVWLLPMPLADLRCMMAAMLAVTPLQAVELYLLGDADLAVMNAQYMDAPGCTNILSFPGCGAMPGSLFLSLDAWERECMLYGQPATAHLARLLAHGLAHLTGLDHGPPMTRVEERCLEAATRLDFLQHM